MKFEKISVNELLPTGSFLNTRIEIVGSLDEGEDPKEAAKIAYQLLHEIHRENFPSMYSDNKPIYKGEEEPPVVVQSKKELKSTVEMVIEEIERAEYINNTEGETDGLLSLKNLADSNPVLKQAFAAKYNELLEKGLWNKPKQ